MGGRVDDSDVIPRPARASGPHLRLPRTAVVVLLAGTLAGAGGAAAPAVAAEPRVASARSEAAALRAQVDEIGRRLAETTAAYETARFDLALATAEQVRVQRAREQAESTHLREQQALRSRVRGAYTSGGGVALLAALFAGRDPVDVLTRAAAVQDVLTADREALRSSEQARRTAEGAHVEAAARARGQVAVDAATRAEARRIEGLLAEQRRLLDAADAEVRRLVEEEAARERRRAAEAAAREEAATREAVAARGGAVTTRARVVPGDPGQLPGSTYGGSSSDPGRGYRPATTAGMACPVGPVHSFADTWLAARSGGRRHQGTDVFAPYGSTAYAVVDGVVDKVGDGGLGGITLWIRSASGDRFYYAHNAANLVAVGDRVTAGQPVALVGKTGNAATTPPHVHFEAHPGGGAAANPYGLLKAVCG